MGALQLLNIDQRTRRLWCEGGVVVTPAHRKSDLGDSFSSAILSRSVRSVASQCGLRCFASLGALRRATCELSRGSRPLGSTCCKANTQIRAPLCNSEQLLSALLDETMCQRIDIIFLALPTCPVHFVNEAHPPKEHSTFSVCCVNRSRVGPWIKAKCRLCLGSKHVEKHVKLRHDRWKGNDDANSPCGGRMKVVIWFARGFQNIY